MTINIRMMAIANGMNPAAPGTIVTVDSVAARTMPNFCVIEISGTTAQRPQAGQPGFLTLQAGNSYYDTSLSKTIYFDGQQWRDPTTGSVV